MKSSRQELDAVAAVEAAAVVVKAKKPRKTKAEREREAKDKQDLWLQTTKVVVPAWFGNCSAKGGIKLSQTFTASGLLALICVGVTKGDESTGFGACEITMQMRLRPSGFDRQEARDVAEKGFSELVAHKLVVVAKISDRLDYPNYKLNAKGEKWFNTICKSAGCTPTADNDF